MVEVIEVLVKAGDKIDAGTGLITLETDKSRLWNFRRLKAVSVKE